MSQGIGFFAKKLPYDSFLYSAVTNPATASVVFPAVVGTKWIIDCLVLKLVLFGFAGASSQVIRILDGAAIIAEYKLAATSTATTSGTDQLALTNLAIAGSIGNAVTIAFQLAAPASTFQYIEAGAYSEG